MTVATLCWVCFTPHCFLLSERLFMIASMRVAGAQLDSPVGTCVWHRGSKRGLTKCQTFWPHFLPVPAIAPYHLSFFCWLSKDNNFYTCFDEFFVCLCFDECFMCLCFDEFFACSCLFGMDILFSHKVFFHPSSVHGSCVLFPLILLWGCCGVAVFFGGGGGICRGVYFVPITNFVLLFFSLFSCQITIYFCVCHLKKGAAMKTCSFVLSCWNKCSFYLFMCVFWPYW